MARGAKIAVLLLSACGRSELESASSIESNSDAGSPRLDSSLDAVLDRTPEDQSPSKSPPHVQCARRFGGPGTQTIRVAVDDAGEIYATGWFDQQIDLGGPGFVAAPKSGENAFLARFGPNCEYRWSRQLAGSAGGVLPLSLSIHPAGYVVLGGGFSGTLDLGDGPMVSAPSLTGGSSVDGFIAVYDSEGTYVWGRHIGLEAGYPFSTPTSVDNEGNILVAGAFGLPSDFGSGPVAPASGLDLFVARYSVDGSLLGLRHFANANWELMTDVAATSSGGVVLSGSLSGSMDFGGGPLVSAGLSDVFLAKLDSSFEHVWSKRFGDPSWQHGLHVELDSAQDGWLLAEFRGSINFGSGPLSYDVDDQYALAVGRFHADGSFASSTELSAPGGMQPNGMAVTPAGDVLVSGSFFGSLALGNTKLTSKYAMFVTKLDTAGQPVWGLMLAPDAVIQQWVMVASSPPDALVLAGAVTVNDLGVGPAPGAIGDGEDAFFVKLVE